MEFLLFFLLECELFMCLLRLSGKMNGLNKIKKNRISLGLLFPKYIQVSDTPRGHFFVHVLAKCL